ncbi:MAG: BamA/TamA family outer membrane protein [Flavobacterium sp.]|nr:BamA/TamA family outer membrane protein [Flavobacterium sp.]
MKNSVTKIVLFILIGMVYSGCNSLKRVPKGKYLLIKNEIKIDGKKVNQEEIVNLLYQKPNTKILGYRFRLNMFNLARKNPDSAYKAKFINNPQKLKRQIWLLSAKQVKRKGESFLYAGLDDFLKKTGEAPVLVDKFKSEKSMLRLKSYFFNNGYFHSKADFKIDTLSSGKAKVNYTVSKGNVSYIDTIQIKIQTPALDSLFQKTKNLSLIKKGAIFKSQNFDAERERITTYYRNNGAFYFQKSNISFDIDTIATNNKSNIDILIADQAVRQNDSTVTKPFKIFKISEVNIYTDVPTDKNQIKVNDSVTFKKFNLYSYKKLKYRPNAITDAIFITPGSTYSDIRTSLTSRYLSNLKIFNYPSIQYKVDENDSTGSSLIAKIVLTPRKKYSFRPTIDFTHSTIQNFGIAGSMGLTIRNVFNRAETFDIAARGNIGSSKDFNNPNNLFFNISEYGLDTKLSFPRVLSPINTERIIPKTMLPFTTLNLGFAKQKNIGLDKENFTGSMSYNWTPKKNNSVRFDLFNLQYVNNINVDNYFNVYKSSYNALNAYANAYNINPDYLNSDGNLTINEGGTALFINDVLTGKTVLTSNDKDYKKIRSIEERRVRLTENNLILASSFSFSKNTKVNLQDNNFYAFKTKIESAGNVMSLFANASKTLDGQQNKKTIFGIEYSQYIKTEFEYIKHWDLTGEKVFATRAFFGIAIPYGNSENIPFSRSYFAGGSNDIRAWQPYGLGPGSSGGVNDFNEANLKLNASAELRFKIFNSLKGALFVDAGNIWNVLDNVKDETYTFTGLKSLENTAVGSGFGFRYDLSFFVVRFDLGFKTYNPADLSGKKWFRDYNVANSVLNIGINYPF